ncbi:MAG: tetratricopeptide repeat protein [Vampirovibrionales bacterium]
MKQQQTLQTTRHRPKRMSSYLSVVMALLWASSILVTAWAYCPLSGGHPYSSNSQTWMHRGQQHLAEGRYAFARDATMQALRYVPFAEASAPLYQQLAWAYVGLGESSLAVASLQTAVRLTPSNTVYYQNMVDIWKQQGQVGLVRQQLAEVLRYESEQGDGWFLLGLLYLVEDQAEATTTAWQQHLLLHPRSGHRLFICRYSQACENLKLLQRN